MAAHGASRACPLAFAMRGPGAQHVAPLRDAEGVAFFYCGGLLASLVAIDDGEDFVGAGSGIPPMLLLLT